MAESSRQNKANFRPAEWDVVGGEEWLVELASGEPAASRMATCGRPNGGVRRPSTNEGRRRVTWRPAVGRTAGSGDPRRTSECGERELAVMEKCQNKANLRHGSMMGVSG